MKRLIILILLLPLLVSGQKLISCYKFNGNGNDAMGVHNGTWSNTYHEYLPSIYNQGTRCTNYAQNTYLNTGYEFPITAAFTISFWFKSISSITDGYYYFCAQFNSGATQALLILITSKSYAPDVGYFEIEQIISGVAFRANSLARVDNQKWHFAEIKYSGTVLSLYLDNVFQNSMTHTQTAAGRNMTIGGLMDYNLSNTYCIIDDWRFYNYYLSDGESKSQYAYGLGLYDQ